MLEELHEECGVIGIYQMHAEINEMLGSGTLAAAYASGEAENPGFAHLKPANCR